MLLKLKVAIQVFSKQYLFIRIILILILGTLMQIWKSGNIFAFIWKRYVEDFTLKHHLLFEICAREIREGFVYKCWITNFFLWILWNF